jgi:hypothetical protein
VTQVCGTTGYSKVTPRHQGDIVPMSRPFASTKINVRESMCAVLSKYV